MSDDGTRQEPIDYPWYRLVTDGSLEQGDLLFDFPFVSVLATYDEIMADQVGSAEKVFYDIVVLTQSCDLAKGKVEHVLLCPFFRKAELGPKFKGLDKSGGEKEVQRGKWESLYLLPPCQVGGINQEPRIVNFRQVLAVPFDVVAVHAIRQAQRARLCPPYREHLAQAFARFIMRIGFPIDFVLP